MVKEHGAPSQNCREDGEDGCDGASCKQFILSNLPGMLENRAIRAVVRKGISKGSGQEIDAEEEEEEEDDDIAEPCKEVFSHDDDDFAKATGILEGFRNGMERKELAERFGVTYKKTCKILRGATRSDFSSKHGREPHLTLQQEAYLAHIIKELFDKHMITCTSRDISYFAQVIWRSAHHDDAAQVPKFHKNWLKGFRERRPHHFLKAVSVKPVVERRRKASTRSNVNHALQGVKCAVGKRESWQVFAVDEVDVSANDKATGKRAYALEGLKPIHLTGHITCVPFTCLNGSVIANPFIVAGTESLLEKGRDMHSPKPEHGDVIFNKSGSSEKSQLTGEKGSWRLCCECFVRELEKKHGKVEDGRETVMLILDGFSAHEDLETNTWLKARGVEVLRISPNLTQLIQLNDNGRLNGKVQERVRTLKARLYQLNYGEEIALERRLYEIEIIVRNTMTMDNVAQAAREIGFVYDVDFQHVWMTDDSITKALNNMESNGKLAWDSEENKDDYELRSRSILNMKKFVNAKMVCSEMKEFMVPEVIFRTAQAADDFSYARSTFGQPLTDRKEQKVVVKRVGTPKKGGTCVLTDATNLEKAEAKREDLLCRQKAAETRKLMRQENRVKKDAEAKLKADRLSLLKGALPDVPVEDYLHNISTYLTGRKTLDEAKEIVIRAVARKQKRVKMNRDEDGVAK